MTYRRLGGESGLVSAELVLGVGLLVLPVALLVLTMPGWFERQVAARSIAREAARAVVLEGRCSQGLAARVAGEMAANHGLAVGDVRVSVQCESDPLPPGSEIEADVSVRMPALEIPGIGAFTAWEWTARHRAPVDRYASLP
jgi:hypothetical protein